MFSLNIFGIFEQGDREKIQQTAERFKAAYNSQDYAAVGKEFNSQMKAAVPPDALREFLDETHADFGKIVNLGTADFSDSAAANFRVEFERGKLDLLIALDWRGKIAGLRLSPAQVAKPKNTKRNQTQLSLPLEGEWLVFWGGDDAEQNYHQNAPDQRFAFDLVKTDAGGKTHRRTGKRNEDYYAFGQEIIAPADGVVTYVVDGVHDNVPGEVNRMFAAGNTVIIRHADGEYSLFAHFKQNSIRVKAGDQVTRGQTIGLCGNSGNSSEAHLHYQFQDTPFFSDEASMKTFFEKLIVRRGGKTEVKTDYSPVKGDIISN